MDTCDIGEYVMWSGHVRYRLGIAHKIIVFPLVPVKSAREADLEPLVSPTAPLDPYLCRRVVCSMRYDPAV